MAQAEGLCSRCCKRQPETGYKVCRSCQGSINEFRQRRRVLAQQRTELQQIVLAHERAGDLAREHHLYADAAHRYQDALGVRAIVSEDCLRISEKLAGVLALGNDPGSADSWYDNLLTSQLAHSKNSAEVVETLLRIARQLWIASKSQAKLPVLTRAIHIAELANNPVLFKKASVIMANTLFQLARYDETERVLHKMGEVTDEDSIETRVAYWVQRGVFAAAYGREEEVFESFDRAVHTAGDRIGAYQATALWSDYALAAIMLGRTQLTKMHIERALLMARQNNVVWRIPQICLHYAGVLTRMGQQTLALEYLADALSYDAKVPVLDETFASIGIPLALHVKDPTILEKCARTHAIELAFRSAESSRIGHIAAAFARLYQEQGEPRKAQALLHRAVNAMRDGEFAWDLPVEVARCGAETDIPQARRLFERRIALPHADMAEAHLRLFDAFVAQRQRRTSEAYAHARDAAVRFDALQWSAYADLARSILPAHQRVSGAEVSQTKPFSYAELPLTEREREIAGLVLRGYTSRTIAAKLSISPHTVDSHVNSIMNRLGLHSRHQLAYVLTEPVA